MNVLIVDDEGNIRRMLRALLESEGYGARVAKTGAEAVEAVRERPPDVILLDLVLPGIGGLDALQKILDAAPGLPVVMMSGRATLSDAVEATRLGAFHFLEKPLTPEAVLVTLRGAMEVSRARDLTRVLQEELGPETELVGRSPEIVEVRERIRKLAPTRARVLITGESGTGKELAAAALHGLSSRKDGPFIRLNSAAIPGELLESEMFGHEEGAFTGAGKQRRGRFELAHGGTLFLDEVADLSPGAQAKLLRAVETGEVQRVGGSGTVEVDVRIVTASNRNLRDLVDEDRFREDLLFRLEGIPLHLPPLRERSRDIPLLVDHAQDRLRRREGLPPATFGPDAMEALQEYGWPGNVRELFNIVERLTILHGGQRISGEEIRKLLPSRVRSGDDDLRIRLDDSRPLSERLEEYERRLVSRALERSGGNVSEASRILKTDRANLYRKMRRLGIRDGEGGPE